MALLSGSCPLNGGSKLYRDLSVSKQRDLATACNGPSTPPCEVPLVPLQHLVLLPPAADWLWQVVAIYMWPEDTLHDVYMVTPGRDCARCHGARRDGPPRIRTSTISSIGTPSIWAI